MDKNKLPLLIAVIGADGSGKSTLCQALLLWLQAKQPTRLCHLGRQTGSIARKLARLPWFGKKLDSKIAKKSDDAKRNQGPSGIIALIIFVFSLRRIYRFCNMLKLRKQGYIIITDRYPQIAVVGGLDGPDLMIEHPKSRITKFLTRRERALYRWMASYTPDLVIRLNVDIETAMKRKPDHRLTSIKNKIESVPKLSFNGAPILDLDTKSLSFEKVLENAKKEIIQHFEIAL